MHLCNPVNDAIIGISSLVSTWKPFESRILSNSVEKEINQSSITTKKNLVAENRDLKMKMYVENVKEKNKGILKCVLA